MSKRRNGEYLKDIREAIRRINVYTAGFSFEQFMEDIKTQDAVIRNLEVIGEATKNLSSRLTKSYPDIPWREMAGVRDKMIHHYFGINYDIVWTTAKKRPASTTSSNRNYPDKGDWLTRWRNFGDAILQGWRVRRPDSTGMSMVNPDLART